MKRKYSPAEFEGYLNVHNYKRYIWNTGNQMKTRAYDCEHINMNLIFTSLQVFHFPTCIILSDSATENRIIINNFEYALHQSSTAQGSLFEIVYKVATKENTYYSVNLMLK